MAKINLLPWRDERREQQKKEFYTILGVVAVVGALCIVAAHMVVQGRIEYQNERNAYLQRNITELNKQVEEIKGLQQRRAELLERMQVIQDLQGNRPLIVHLFEELVTALPQGLYFRSVQRQGDVLTIDGTSESNPRISSLMRSLDQQDHYQSPNLRSVTETDEPNFGEQASDFRMTVNVQVPTAQNQQGGG